MVIIHFAKIVSILLTDFLETTCGSNTVRLEGSTVPYAGRLEVCYNGLWGTVCDDFFDQVDADVVCQQLNYSSALAPSTYYGPGSGPVWLDNVACMGNESSILECAHAGVGTHNCAHSEDVGIICQRKKQSCNISLLLTFHSYS